MMDTIREAFGHCILNAMKGAHWGRDPRGVIMREWEGMAKAIEKIHPGSIAPFNAGPACDHNWVHNDDGHQGHYGWTDCSKCGVVRTGEAAVVVPVSDSGPAVHDVGTNHMAQKFGEKPKPCPFCGKDGWYRIYGDTGKHLCSCPKPNCPGWRNRAYQCRKSAVVAWNERVDPIDEAVQTFFNTTQAGNDLDPNVAAVMTSHARRAQFGKEKYGCDTTRTDLTPLQWITHAQEEAMDMAVYLERLKGEVGIKQIDVLTAAKAVIDLLPSQYRDLMDARDVADELAQHFAVKVGL